MNFLSQTECAKPTSHCKVNTDRMAAAAAFSVIVVQNKFEFRLKMVKNFNLTADKYSLTKRELFVAIFDEILASAEFESKENLVVTLKHVEPRVTLLISRQNPAENVDHFKLNFARRVERYLTSNRCEKDFYVIFAIDEQENNQKKSK